MSNIADVKPTRDLILVLPVPNTEQTTPGGIILLNVPQEFDSPRWGTVISVGSNVDAVKPGQSVLIDAGCGVQMSFQNTDEAEINEFLFLKEDHLLLVLEP